MPSSQAGPKSTSRAGIPSPEAGTPDTLFARACAVLDGGNAELARLLIGEAAETNAAMAFVSERTRRTLRLRFKLDTAPSDPQASSASMAASMT